METPEGKKKRNGFEFKRFQDRALAGITILCLSLVGWIYQGDHNELKTHLRDTTEIRAQYDKRLSAVEAQEALDKQRIDDAMSTLKEINNKLDALLLSQGIRPKPGS